MRSLLTGYIKLVRPKQWLKNSFVLAPLIFGKELFIPHQAMLAIIAFTGFCLTASAVYILNDIVDVRADRAHPEKRNRPIAAGVISTTQAVTLLVLVIAAAGSLALLTPLRFGLVLAAYFLMNLAYSFRLKEVVLLDVFVIAAGFMLRVMGGAIAIGVPVSSWLVLCTMFISLFLGFGKRRGEIVLSQEIGQASGRRVLQLYRVDFLDHMLTITAAGTMIAYALYTVSPRTIEVFGTDKMIYTTVFVIYGVFRYLYLVHMSQQSENPTNAVTSDAPILLTGVLWICTCALLIYSGSHTAGGVP